MHIENGYIYLTDKDADKRGAEGVNDMVEIAIGAITTVRPSVFDTYGSLLYVSVGQDLLGITCAENSNDIIKMLREYRNGACHDQS